MSDFHRKYKWQKVRKAIVKHSGNLCANPFGLHSNKGMIIPTGNPTIATVSHHIVPVEFAPELATLASNIVPLCDKCHAYAHELLRTLQGRAIYRKVFHLPLTTKLTADNSATKPQPFFTKEICRRLDDGNFYCVRCGKVKSRPCAACSKSDWG